MDRKDDAPNVSDDEKLFTFLIESLNEIINAYRQTTSIMLGIIEKQKKDLNTLFPKDPHVHVNENTNCH